MVEQVPKRDPRYGAENLDAGDVILTNDPYPSGVHLNDVSLISPVYVDGELLGYVANLAHHVDVGGGAPGQHRRVPRGVPGGRDHPAGQARRGGGIVDDVFRLVLAQIRSKHETGRRLPRADRRQRDRRPADAGARRARHGRETIVATMDELLAYTERRTRAELAALPHGVYEAEGIVDNDGYTDEPCACGPGSRSRPDGVRFDTTGSDPQRRAPVNSTYAMTFSACAYALKCLIDPDLPVNDGFYRLVTVDAPRGHGHELHLAGAGRRRLGDAGPRSSR